MLKRIIAFYNSLIATLCGSGNIHTQPSEGDWVLHWGGESRGPKLLKRSMNETEIPEVLGGRGFKPKKPRCVTSKLAVG